MAVSAAPYVHDYWCTDGVEVSQNACKMHVDCYVHSGNVHVVSPEQLLALRPKCEVAVNIHSWNECSFASIAAWLDILGELKTPYLFTVSHGARFVHTKTFGPLTRQWLDSNTELWFLN